MADPHVVSQLQAKQAELRAAVVYLEDKLTEAKANLLHVNATLRLFDMPDDGASPPIGHINLTRVFRRGELLALTIAALNDAPGPLTTRTLSVEVISRKGWDMNDPVLRRGITAKLKLPLIRASRAGKLTASGFANGLRLWSLPQKW